MIDELVEAVARKLCGTRFLNGGDETDDGWDDCPEDLRAQYLELARAAIAVVIERCAKECEDRARDSMNGHVNFGDALAIRKLGESE